MQRFLGCPIGDLHCVSAVLVDKIHLLKVMGERLQHIFTHDAFLLLRHSFALPKLLYTLRTSPCFLSPSLQLYNDALSSIMSSVFNIDFHSNDPAWLQATLPVKCGGLGIRSAVQLAPSAFLASAAGSSDLVHQILPSHLQGTHIPSLDAAATLWSLGHDQPPPEGSLSHRQHSWDSIIVSVVAENLLNNDSDCTTRARLLAAASNESGKWLDALPISSLGLRMDDVTFQVAVGLRVGSSLSRPHSCHHCGTEVDHLALHGLSCRWSVGRHHRHAAVNDIIHRALSSAHVSARLEPSGMDRTDGKRPDGITLVPWKNGKLLVWDATCPDTFAPSYISSAISEAGAVASLAEQRKRAKYINLGLCHLFQLVAIETTGAIGPQSLEFLKELGQ